MSKKLSPPTSWFGKFRDHLTFHVCTWIYKNIATEWYCEATRGVMLRGLGILEAEKRKK